MNNNFDNFKAGPFNYGHLPTNTELTGIDGLVSLGNDHNAPSKVMRGDLGREMQGK